jgi:hypothetical protein
MTSKQRREFTPAFKREAVGLLASSGRTIREIAGDLDLGGFNRSAQRCCSTYQRVLKSQVFFVDGYLD